MEETKQNSPIASPKQPSAVPETTDTLPQPDTEIGGSNKPEPTRYGDWEIGGKCIDF